MSLFTTSMTVSLCFIIYLLFNCVFFYTVELVDHKVLFVGPLIPLLLTSRDVCPAFESQGGSFFHSFSSVWFSDSPLVRHLLTLFWSATWSSKPSLFDPVTFPKALVEIWSGVRTHDHLCNEHSTVSSSKLSMQMTNRTVWIVLDGQASTYFTSTNNSIPNSVFSASVISFINVICFY